MSFANFIEQMRQEEAEFEEKFEADLKPRLFAYLDTQPERYLIATFSGGGDQGGVDEIFFVGELTEEQQDWLEEANYGDDLWFTRETRRRWQGSLYGHNDDPNDQLVADAAGVPQNLQHGSWADGGGYRAEGIIVWDKQERTITLRELETFEEYTTQEREF